MATELEAITQEDIVDEYSRFQENLQSFMDDIFAERYRRATSTLFFAFENLLRTSLFVLGIEPRSHEAIARLFSS